MAAVEPYPGCEPIVCTQPWASSRVVMVGEGPSRSGSANPRHALTGRPMRFLFEVCAPELELMSYIRTFERHNLLPSWPGYQGGGPDSGSAFPIAEASIAARALELRCCGRRVLIWGRRAAAAFRRSIAEQPYLEWWPCRLPSCAGADADDSWESVAVMPHPSGLNRWWNDQANRAAARAFILSIVAEVRGARLAHQRST